MGGKSVILTVKKRSGIVSFSGLIGILRFVEASVTYFPLFACVDAPAPLIGYVIGLLFTPLL